jgi:murein DD-endopeptidase MepM/ murein hydrolase activator NlpD
MPHARPSAKLSLVLAALALCAGPQSARADQTFFPIVRAPEARFLPAAHPHAAAGQILPRRGAQFFPVPVRRAALQPAALRPGATAGVIRADPAFLGLPKARPARPHAAPPARADAGHLWPVDAAVASRISSGFGWRADPFTGKPAFHAAVDIAAPAGTWVVATAPATVQAIGEHPRLGRYVMLAYADGSVATYGHLSDFAVGTGDVVARGAHIGKVGSTGRATGPHLDFSLEVAGGRIDPLSVLRPPTTLVAGH